MSEKTFDEIIADFNKRYPEEAAAARRQAAVVPTGAAAGLAGAKPKKKKKLSTGLWQRARRVMYERPKVINKQLKEALGR